jgi:hypothetical protein
MKMPKIYAYQKHIDAQVTRELLLPEGEGHQRLGTELATLDGITYVSLPDGADIPTEQPAEISASIEEVALTNALRDAIASASPHVALIRARVVEKIVARYSASDEIKLLRLNAGAQAPSAEFSAYNAFVEECRQWGRDEKAKLGL